jgi:type VI secretion system FHA domain protein
MDGPRAQPPVRFITSQREAARAAPPRSAGSRTVVLPPAAAPAAAAASATLPSAPPRAPAAGRDQSSLIELLRAAGLTERDASPETLRELGQVLRIVVQGVMEVLHARTDIKAQFRLPQTRVQARENNPLKLSPNVESALHTLLVQRNAAYLRTVPAFEEAFADIRNHQLALLEGVRVAFDSMLEAFDPRELQKGFDTVVKRGGPLSGVLGGKSQYWNLYVERFTALQRDADDTFRRLFGDVFAQAYERQLERLKSLANQRN